MTGKRVKDPLTDFEQNLKDRGRTHADCQLVTARVATILDHCEPESPPSPNEKTPVWQGFEDDCGLVMLAENPEPPVRLELTTYALRKHRSTN